MRSAVHGIEIQKTPTEYRKSFSSNFYGVFFVHGISHTRPQDLAETKQTDTNRVWGEHIHAQQASRNRVKLQKIHNLSWIKIPRNHYNLEKKELVNERVKTKYINI